MQRKSDYILRLCLVIGDAVALIVSFAAAYYIRVAVDHDRISSKHNGQISCGR